MPHEHDSQADLRAGTSPWHAGIARPPGTALARDTRCDVAVVGAGITGALAAEHLTALGLDVLLVDRERAGFGSTLASTAMLQWEIDLGMRDLSRLYGFDRAAEVYRQSFDAVAGLRGLVGRLELPCAFVPRDTVYLAAGEVGPRVLAEEHALRKRVGLPGQLLDHAALRAAYGFDRAAAIVSPGSAEADPLSLCHALLAVAGERGARLVHDEAIAFESHGSSAWLGLESGRTVEAKAIVLATGYTMPDCVRTDLHRVASSFAIATVPQPPQAFWPDRALVWEASEDYIYMRTTTDGRIVIGGEDEDHDDPEKREAAMPAKSEALRRKLAALQPAAIDRIDHSWSGAFGQTGDGLPLIGRVPGHRRLIAAYGYGGNGITFSFMASRMIGALAKEHEERWFHAFALDRPDPGRS